MSCRMFIVAGLSYLSQPVTAFVRDQTIQLSGAQLKARAQLKDNGRSGVCVGRLTTDPKKAGCHGTPVLLKYLEYIDLRTLFLIPVAHCILYGLLKDFLRII